MTHPTANSRAQQPAGGNTSSSHEASSTHLEVDHPASRIQLIVYNPFFHLSFSSVSRLHLVYLKGKL